MRYSNFEPSTVEMGHERPIGTALPMSPIHLIATARGICRAVAKGQSRPQCTLPPKETKSRCTTTSVALVMNGLFDFFE